MNRQDGMSLRNVILLELQFEYNDFKHLYIFLKLQNIRIKIPTGNLFGYNTWDVELLNIALNTIGTIP